MSDARTEVEAVAAKIAAALPDAEPKPEPPAPTAATAPVPASAPAEPAATVPAADPLPTDAELEQWRSMVTPAQHKMLTAERDRILAAREAHAEAIALGAEQLRREIPDYDDPARVKALVTFVAEEYGDAAAHQLVATQGGTDPRLLVGLFRAMDRKQTAAQPAAEPEPEPQRPSDRRARRDANQAAEYARVKARLEKTGRSKDAQEAVKLLGLAD